MMLTSTIDPDGYAESFSVAVHPYQIGQYPGKTPGTRLTLEMQLVNFKIAEWEDSLSIRRQWCFAELWMAALALGMFLGDDAASEPAGWVRAMDENGVRRQSLQEAEAQLAEELQKPREGITGEPPN